VRDTSEVDYIFIRAFKESMAFTIRFAGRAILLPINTVGVVGDERTYEKEVALRAVG